MTARPLISYLPPVDPREAQARMRAAQQPQPTGASKYVGDVAKGYDAKRENTPKHIAEQNEVETFLSDLPAGTWVLDAPCGTGRFFPFYASKGFIVRGLDASADMVNEAKKKISNPNAMVGDVAQWMFALGDVRNTKLPGKVVDVAVNVRITRWLMGDIKDGVVVRRTPEWVVETLKDMQRVARQRIVLTARVRDHQLACTYDIINSALDGWRIHRDSEGYEPAYRILELRPI